MADMLQKGISSISDLLYDQLGLSLTDVTNNTDRLNRFVRCFARLRFKHDEKHFAKSEIEHSRMILNQPSLPLNKKRGELLLLSYLHMIGYDVSFAFIHAINFAQQGDMLSKRTGYLLCSLFFNESHQFALLLINTIVKDLQSSVVANECMALVSCSQLVATVDLPLMTPYITKKLSHRVAILRKKALQCLYAFIIKDPSMLTQVEHHLFNCLKDKDLGVVWAAVEIYLEIAKNKPEPYRHLVPPLTDIISMLLDHKVSPVHEYHGLSSPWFLMSLVKFLAVLARGCKRTTKAACCSYIKIIGKIKTSQRIAFAVWFEVVRSASKLDFISDELSEQICNCIRTFLNSQSLYLRLNGIRLVSMVIPKQPSLALTFQATILEVMQCPDPALQQAVINLLFVMANKSNKEFVCQKILEQICKFDERELSDARDTYNRLVKLVSSFSIDDPLWFVATIFRIIDEAGRNTLDLEPKTVVNFLVNRSGEPIDSNAMEQTRCRAAEMSLEKLKEIGSESIAVRNVLLGSVSVSVLTEFHASASIPSEDVVRLFVHLLPLVTGTELWDKIILSVTSLQERLTADAHDWLHDTLTMLYAGHTTSDPSSRLNFVELQILHRKKFENNSDDARHTIEIDRTFSVLEDYTIRHLESGGAPYARPGINYDRIPRLLAPTVAANKNEDKQRYNSEGIGIPSETSPQMSSANNHVAIEQRDELEALRFSKDSNTIWSASGYSQPPATRQSRDADRSEETEVEVTGATKEDLHKLAQQLFQGF